MSAPQRQSKVVPAQLSFLAIYNPTLGPTDETFRDQLVYWHSRASDESRAAHRKNGGRSTGKGREDELREEENERLRQIGLAQGMVGFARTFSDGEPVDSVETEKSRIVLYELEKGWWILASIDLTRLPAATPAQGATTSNTTGADDAKAGVEYSSREVSPPALLVQQLLQAHKVFLLHHGPALDELFVKLSRERFCSTLERYWNRFSKSWDVLLHGNPSVEIFTGMKLASGGELGFGVGEEEWGSGEREVLEDLTRRTEGLVDSIVLRFGEPIPEETEDKKAIPQDEALPWMGNGSYPAAADGIVYSGVNAISRPTVRSISLWMQHIYAYGDYAYGVRDNPNRERRKRRRRCPPGGEDFPKEARGSRQVDPTDLRQKVQKHEASGQDATTIDPSVLPKDNRPQLHDRVASHDHATNQVMPQIASHPGVPPPIVNAAEEALNKATAQARRPPGPERAKSDDSGKTMGIPDQYMKYMTFGLSSLAKSYTQKRPEMHKRASSASSRTIRPHNKDNRPKPSKQESVAEGDVDKPDLSQVDPMPDGDALKAKIAQQIRGENKGCFVVGLKGDLDIDGEHDNESASDGSFGADNDGRRVVLRTLQVEMTPQEKSYSDEVDDELDRGNLHEHFEQDNPATKNMQRLRVVVYVRRPFVYCFLLEQRTPSLGYVAFYKTLHRNLAPIHKPLLSSTSQETVAQRIESAHANSDPSPASSSLQTNTLPSKPADSPPIFDLLFDPARLTVHTSIPNIPEPGTPAAEGIISHNASTPVPWTRLEALNVHSQILSMLISTSRSSVQIERSSKTARGWWVVWMKLPPSDSAGDERPVYSSRPSQTASSTQAATEPSEPESTVGLPSLQTVLPPDNHRIAFLVRKAIDAAPQNKASTGSRLASGMWSTLALRGGTGEEKTGGASAGWGPAALAGGIGFDARGYVEGLLSLNR